MFVYTQTAPIDTLSPYPPASAENPSSANTTEEPKYVYETIASSGTSLLPGIAKEILLALRVNNHAAPV